MNVGSRTAADRVATDLVVSSWHHSHSFIIIPSSISSGSYKLSRRIKPTFSLCVQISQHRPMDRGQLQSKEVMIRE